MPFHNAKMDPHVVAALIQGQAPGSVNLLDSLASDDHATYCLNLDSLKSIITDCWIRDPSKRPSSSDILNRLVFPYGTEALDIDISGTPSTRFFV